MRFYSILLLFPLLGNALFSQSYQNIEATEYDPTQNRWLTSNGSSIIAQDEAGQLSYFGNASANYGMEVMNGTLFAINSSVIKGYDLVTAEEVMSIAIPGAMFLNGMGSDPATNRLWVSDFNAYSIIELDVSNLSAPTQQTVVTGTVAKPNGVVYDQIDDRLIFASWGTNAAIKSVDLTTYVVTTLVNTGLSNIDGIDMNAAGEFFISSWSPTRITQYDHYFNNPMTVTASGLSNPADISFGNEINTLGVANSGNETLTLITFVPSALAEVTQSAFGLQIFPNPVSTGSRISFDLPIAGPAQLKIRDLQGRVVVDLLDGQQVSGAHQLLFNGISLEEGIYLLELSVAEDRSALPFVVMH